MRLKHYLVFGLLCLVALGVALGAGGSWAKTALPAEPAQVKVVSNASCMECHGVPDLYMTLWSGEDVYLTINESEYDASIHGRLGYLCVQCHTTYSGYPHPKQTATTHRYLTIQQNQNCSECHPDKYEAALDSVHGAAYIKGNKEAATCSDCHGAHNVSAPTRQAIPQTCERCHSEIFNRYKETIHGKALLSGANSDVPTCIDCHGVHSVTGPSEAGFHLFSPQICADCHADEELMGKYGISTDVFNTYIADFHGTTVEIFERIAPDQETNKPVCIDCHGVHDIQKTDDPESHVIKENLLETCQRCHPDATKNFPASWLSHYQPSMESAPLVYLVNLFYQLVIPATVGGLLIFIFADSGHRIIKKIKEGRDG